MGFGLRNLFGGYSLALVAGLTACGGTYEDGVVAQPSAPVPVAPLPAADPAATYDWGWRGAFGATVDRATSQDLILAITADGSLLAVYGDDAATNFKASGFLTAYRIAGSNPGHYSSGAPVSIDVTVDPILPSVSGTLVVAGEGKSVSGGALQAAGYRFDQPTSTAAVVGHWELTTSLGLDLSIDVDNEGAITGALGTCSLFGSKLVPTSTGHGVFAIFLWPKGGLDCRWSGPVSGFAVAYTSMAGGTQLVVGAWDWWDGFGLAAAGKR
jgi:hypothetical protein